MFHCSVPLFVCPLLLLLLLTQRRYYRCIWCWPVGTKSDLAARRQVSPEEGQVLALELGAAGWAEVSSCTGDGGIPFPHLLTITLYTHPVPLLWLLLWVGVNTSSGQHVLPFG
jgi:hypothetical protein